MDKKDWTVVWKFDILQVSFTLNKEMAVTEGLENHSTSVPRQHTFSMQPMGGQALAVFTENSSGNFSFLFFFGLFFICQAPASGTSAANRTHIGLSALFWIARATRPSTLVHKWRKKACTVKDGLCIHTNHSSLCCRFRFLRVFLRFAVFFSVGGCFWTVGVLAELQQHG